MIRPILKIEVGSLGFGGGQPKGIEEYKDLQQQLKKWFEEQPTIYLNGYQVRSLQISICEQFDTLHSIDRETITIRAKGGEK